MPFNINSSNYDLYKKVFELLWQHKLKALQFAGVPDGLDIDEISPIKALTRLEAKSVAMALKGLKAGLVDEVTGIGTYATLEYQSLLDADLKAANLPGFFEIYGEVKNILQKVLKKQRISSLTEYYLVNEVLSDTLNNLGKNDLLILNKAIGDFESAKSGT